MLLLLELPENCSNQQQRAVVFIDCHATMVEARMKKPQWTWFSCGLLELTPFEGLTEVPMWWSNVCGGGNLAIAGCHSERDPLTNQNTFGLPIHAPISCHWQPVCVGSFEFYRCHVPSATNVVYQDEIEVLVAIECEPDAALLYTGHSGGNSA